MNPTDRIAKASAEYHARAERLRAETERAERERSNRLSREDREYFEARLRARKLARMLRAEIASLT